MSGEPRFSDLNSPARRLAYLQSCLQQAHAFHDLFEQPGQDEEPEPDGFVGPTHDEQYQAEFPSDDDPPCSNSFYRPDMWLKARSEEQRMELDDDLMSLWHAADIQPCESQKCRKYLDMMETTAPHGGLEDFRLAAMTAMSCQLAMCPDPFGSENENFQRQCDLFARTTKAMAHTHISNLVALCLDFLKQHEKDEHLNTADFDWSGTSDLIYWMANIQYEKGVGSKTFGRWASRQFKHGESRAQIHHAAEQLNELKTCQHRLWALVEVSDRKEADLPDILRTLRGFEDHLLHDRKVHQHCTAAICQRAQVDTTLIKPSHAPGYHDDGEGNLNVKELKGHAISGGGTTTWGMLPDDNVHSTFAGPPFPAAPSTPYVAISHVWEDGTGNSGPVPFCRFKHFACLANLGRSDESNELPIWWDVLSVPSGDGPERAKALDNMHDNYARAEFTVVHDAELSNYPWASRGDICLALVLSTWFTRGWTALELAVSKRVKVAVKDPEGSDVPVLMDLDDDILAFGPECVSRAHWIAKAWIRRLREPIDDVGDIVAILSRRSTSRARDMSVIAALLAGVTDMEHQTSERDMTRAAIRFLGKIPYSSLLHGECTLSDNGAFSWATCAIANLPTDIPVDLKSREASDQFGLLDVDYGGAVRGLWRYRTLDLEEAAKISSHGPKISSVLKVEQALSRPSTCLLLRPLRDSQQDLSVLVQVLDQGGEESSRQLECRYVGAVSGTYDRSTSGICRVNIGGVGSNLLPFPLEPAESENPTWALSAIAAMSEQQPNRDRLEMDWFSLWSAEGSAMEPWFETLRDPEHADSLGEDVPFAWDTADATEQNKNGNPSRLNSLHFRMAMEKRSRCSPGDFIDIQMAENAMRLLSSADVWPDAEDLHALMEARFLMDPSESQEVHNLSDTFRALGDLLLERGFHRRALQAYYEAKKVFVMEEEFEQFVEEAQPTAEELDFSDTGNDAVDAGELELSPELDAYADQTMNPDRRLLWADLDFKMGKAWAALGILHMARRLFRQVHRSCRSRARVSIEQDNEANWLEDLGQSTSQHETSVWKHLELDNLTQLTILYLRVERYDLAADAYYAAIKFFDTGEVKINKNVEIYSQEPASNDEEGRPERLERCIWGENTYRRALWTFRAIFPKSHPLVHLTAFHLGATLIRRLELHALNIPSVEDLEETGLKQACSMRAAECGTIASKYDSAAAHLESARPGLTSLDEDGTRLLAWLEYYHGLTQTNKNDAFELAKAFHSRSRDVEVQG